MGRFSRKVEQMKFAWYCFQKGNDAQFVRNVKNAEVDFNKVSLEKFGNKSDESMIYFIDMKESHSGFLQIITDCFHYYILQIFMDLSQWYNIVRGTVMQKSIRLMEQKILSNIILNSPEGFP